MSSFSATLNDLDRFITTLQKCETIKESEVKDLCDKAKEILSKEENLVNV